jgi:hypothetical protein
MKPSPWIMFLGGIAMINVAMLVGGLHAPAWVRYPGMVLLAGIGVFSLGAGLHRGLAKKPERPKFVPRRKRPPGE